MEKKKKKLSGDIGRVDFFGKLKVVRKLNQEQKLYATLGAFKENLKCRYCKSAEIFEVVYDDPAGTEYWLGWFDKPALTLEVFTSLLATHMVAEHADNLAPEKPYDPIEMYSASRDIIKRILHDMAKMKGLKFKIELDAMSDMRAGNEVLLLEEWITDAQGYRQPKTVDQRQVHPRQAMKCIAEYPGRAELLPESLCNWWATQSTTESIVEIAQDETPDVKSTTRMKQVFHPIQPYFDNIGDYWQVHFQAKTISLKKTKGLPMIAFLVSRPYKTFKPEELSRLISNPIEVVHERLGDGYSEVITPQPKRDAKTLMAVRRRLEELNDNPLPDPEENMRQKQQLEEYIRKMSKVRYFSDYKERVRSSVDKVIRRTIKRIKKYSPELHQHLTQTILARSSPRWSYHPKPVATKDI